MRVSALLSTRVMPERSEWPYIHKRGLETVRKTEYGYFLISYASPQRGPTQHLLEASAEVLSSNLKG